MDSDPNHHQAFLSVDKFTPQHLKIPQKFEFIRSAFFSYILSAVPLVVRIHGRFISSERPETTDSGYPYLFSEHRGDHFNTVGSGYVRYVRKVKADGELDGSYTSWYQPHLDTCHVCRTSVTSQDNIWMIVVRSARHVIYDDSESSQCQVVFFDDKNDVRDVVKKTHWAYGLGDADGDYCNMFLLTGDEELVMTLEKQEAGRRERRRELEKLLGECEEMEESPVVVLSHPHGRKLYVTCGQHRGEVDDKAFAVMYDARTCSGCSGGLVLDLHRGRYFYSSFPHSGVSDTGLGQSADCWVGV